jgi:exodeoxyribonuclease VII large subunit
MPAELRSYHKLSDLTQKITRAIEDQFGAARFWVLAEISNLNYNRQRGNYFFECIEKSSDTNDIRARISAAIWNSDAPRVSMFERVTGQQFREGIQMLMQVSVSFHPVYGLKLRIHDIDPSYTIGALEQQKQANIQRLLTECADAIVKVGDQFITNNKKLTLRPVLQRIAVLSSSSAAGYEDFKQLIQNNEFGYVFELDSYYTLVQGEQNATALYRKLLEIYNTKIRYDAVVIIRGGGSTSDFLIFDQFELGKIVARYPYPVITGIGHQKNETIVDMMAHTANTSPSKAAEFIIAHNRKFETSLIDMKNRIIIQAQRRIANETALLHAKRSFVINRTRDLINDHRQGINLLSAGLLVKPRILIASEKKHLQQFQQRLQTASMQLIKSKNSDVSNALSLVRAMAPANILKKGFAIIKQNERVIVDASKLEPGDTVNIILSGKELESIIQSKKDYHGTDIDL